MTIVRWLLVLPASFVAAAAVQMIGGTAVNIAMRLVGAGESTAAEWLQLAVAYFVAACAFVVAGAKVAPRRQSATAVVLAVVGIGPALTQHVVVQQLAGNRVGTTNYLHAGLEMAGLLAGVAVMITSQRMRRPAR